jgi:WD40 repeat protein
MVPIIVHLLLAAWLVLAVFPAQAQEAATEDKKPVAAVPAARVDLYGDRLPPGAVARLGTNSRPADFNDLIFRADGREFYSYHLEGLLRVHDAVTGKVLRAFRLPDASHLGGQFSADGRFITLAIPLFRGHYAAKALTIWETATGKLCHRIEAGADASFYPWDASLRDGRTLVTREAPAGGAVRLWDLGTGKNRLLRKTSEGVIRFASTPDGKRLFVQTYTSLGCWNVADGKREWQLPGGGSEVVAAPDGRALLVDELILGKTPETRFQLLDPATGEPPRGLRPPRKQSGWAQWGADSRTLLIHQREPSGVRIWDLEAGEERGFFPCEYGPIAVAPDGKSLLSTDRGLQRWDLRTKRPLFPSTAERGHTRKVEDLACSPDGKILVSADIGGSVFIWDLRTNRPLRIVHDLGCERLAFTPDGRRLVIGTKDDSILVCDPMSGKVLDRPKLEGLQDFEGLRGSDFCLCDDDRLILNHHTSAVSVRVWPGGPSGVTGAWDLKTGKRLWLRSVESRGTEALTGLSPDGRLGVAWDLALREAQRGRLVGRLGEKDGQGQAVNHGTEFSPDGSLIAAQAYRRSGPGRSGDWTASGIEVWERATCRLVRRLPVKGWLLSFAFAPDGRRLAALRGDELWVWDVARGKELLHVKSPRDVASWRGRRMTFLPTGRALALATDDGSILLWEVPAVAPARLPVLADAQLRRAWEDLSDPDPAQAFAAVAELADRPRQGLSLLKERLRPVTPLSAEKVRRLIAALDDRVFASREAAERELAALGPRVWPALRAARAKRPSAEATQRLERLLDEKRVPSEDMLRSLRAVRVLELVGTSAARHVLKSLSSGDPDALLTQEASAALRRLGRRGTEAQ